MYQSTSMKPLHLNVKFPTNFEIKIKKILDGFRNLLSTEEEIKSHVIGCSFLKISDSFPRTIVVEEPMMTTIDRSFHLCDYIIFKTHHLLSNYKSKKIKEIFTITDKNLLIHSAVQHLLQKLNIPASAGIYPPIKVCITYF